MILLSAIDDSIPLVCPPSSTLSKSLEICILSLQEQDQSSISASRQKLDMMTKITLLAGRVLHYIDYSNKGFATEETYPIINHDMGKTMNTIIRSDGSHTWSFCDTIAIALRYGRHPSTDFDPSQVL